MPDPTAPRRADEIEDVPNEVAPEVQDPGEAHRKGYSADPLPKPPVHTQTIPLADTPDKGPPQAEGS